MGFYRLFLTMCVLSNFYFSLHYDRRPRTSCIDVISRPCRFARTFLLSAQPCLQQQLKIDGNARRDCLVRYYRCLSWLGCWRQFCLVIFTWKYMTPQAWLGRLTLAFCVLSPTFSRHMSSPMTANSKSESKSTDIKKRLCNVPNMPMTCYGGWKCQQN